MVVPSHGCSTVCGLSAAPIESNDNFLLTGSPEEVCGSSWQASMGQRTSLSLDGFSSLWVQSARCRGDSLDLSWLLESGTSNRKRKWRLNFLLSIGKPVVVVANQCAWGCTLWSERFCRQGPAPTQCWDALLAPWLPLWLRIRCPQLVLGDQIQDKN